MPATEMRPTKRSELVYMHKYAQGVTIDVGYLGKQTFRIYK